MADITANTSSVTHVRVVAHTVRPMGPNTPMSENHWSIYLILAHGGSVRMNMAAYPGHRAGTLEWSILNYEVSNSALKYWDFPAVQPLEVHHFCEVIAHHGRTQYWMSGGGSGCRFWV
jgi:hypothetical protein